MSYNYEGGNEAHELASAVVSGPPMTLACFFRPTSLTSTMTMLSVSASSGTNFYALQAAGAAAGDPVRAAIGSAGLNVDTTAAYITSAFNHGAAVFASSTDHRVFLNGTNKGTSPTSASATGMNRTNVSGRYSGGTNGTRMFGRIAEAAIWSAALSDEEIAALSDGICPLRVRLSDLVFYAPLVGTVSNLFGGSLTNQAGVPESDPQHPTIIGRRGPMLLAA